MVDAHWLADLGLDVPGSYREIFLALAERGRIPRSLAERLASAAGFRNLIAHQYGSWTPPASTPWPLGSSATSSTSVKS